MRTNESPYIHRKKSTPLAAVDDILVMMMLQLSLGKKYDWGHLRSGKNSSDMSTM
jgi:hypothetical protein